MVDVMLQVYIFKWVLTQHNEVDKSVCSEYQPIYFHTRRCSFFVSLLTVNTHTSAPLKLVLHLFLLGLSWVLNVSTRTDCCRFLWFDLAPLLHAVNVWHFTRVKNLAPVYLSKTKQLQDKTHLYTAVENLIIACFISSLHLEGVWYFSIVKLACVLIAMWSPRTRFVHQHVKCHI